MKKLLLTILPSLCFYVHSFCQDIIILKNGDEIKAKVSEVLTDVVKYKKWENQNGPLYSEAKGNIFMIKYQNGSKDLFANQTASATVAVSSEEALRNNALKTLEESIVSNLQKRGKNQVIKLAGFKKTNGVMRNFGGQNIYTVYFDITVQFIADGWLAGNMFEGYWRQFDVYPALPDLSGLPYTIKKYPRGTVVVLECEANIVNEDNGLKANNFEIKSERSVSLNTLISNNESSVLNKSTGTINTNSTIAKIINGEWKGEIVVKGSKNKYPVEIVCNIDKNEYKINNPAVGCSGVLVIESATESSIYFIENILIGKSICKGGNTLKLIVVNERQLEMIFYRNKTRLEIAKGGLSLVKKPAVKEQIQVGFNEPGLNVNDGFKKTKTGVEYKIISNRTGPPLKQGDHVKFQYIISYKDSTIDNSYNFIPSYDVVDVIGRYHDFRDLLPRMNVGDSGICYLLYDSIFARTPNALPPFMKKGDKLKTTIKILNAFSSRDSVIPDYQREIAIFKNKELAKIEQYLREKNINAKKLNNNVFVEIQRQGAGPKVDSGKVVGIKYTGYNFNGKFFDSNIDFTKQTQHHSLEPFYFIAKQGGAVAGLVEGITLFNQGGKGRIFMPSTLGYGPKGNPPSIAPNESLIFEVEIISVKNLQSTSGLQNQKKSNNTLITNKGIDVKSIPSIPKGFNVDCSYAKEKGSSPFFVTTTNDPDAFMYLNGKLVKLRFKNEKASTKGFVLNYEGEGWKIIVEEKTDDFSNRYGNIWVNKNGQQIKIGFWGTCQIDRGE
jgi:FKBP-type peptidyl-prolyl cis-trans isomerase FkpA